MTPAGLLWTLLFSSSPLPDDERTVTMPKPSVDNYICTSFAPFAPLLSTHAHKVSAQRKSDRNHHLLGARRLGSQLNPASPDRTPKLWQVDDVVRSPGRASSS